MGVARRRSHSFNNFTLRLRTVSGIERPRVSNRPQKIHPPTSIYIYIYFVAFLPLLSFSELLHQKFFAENWSKRSISMAFLLVNPFRASLVAVAVAVADNRRLLLDVILVVVDAWARFAHGIPTCLSSLPLAALPAEMMTFRPTLSPRGVCIRIEMRGQAAFSEGVWGNV